MGNNNLTHAEASLLEKRLKTLRKCSSIRESIKNGGDNEEEKASLAFKFREFDFDKLDLEQLREIDKIIKSKSQQNMQ